MSDKEKLLASIIILLLSAVLSYRIAYVDHKFDTIDDRINKIVEED